MTVPFRLSRFSISFLAALALPLIAAQQQAPGAETEKPHAVTTADPTIPVEDLKLLLEPLTQSELGVEATGWRDLVHDSVKALSDARIAVHRKNRETKDAKTGSPEDNNDAGKKECLAKLAEQQDAKTALLERFGVVLDAYEGKGGDPSEYRTYAKAVSGINVEANDVASSWAAVSGWMKSKDGGIKWSLGILKFIGIMAAFWILAGIGSRTVKKITDEHLDWSELLERFINKLTKRSILLVGLLIALSTAGVNVGALLAVIGGSAFIVGFALQDTLGNFAAGLMLLIYRPFDVGDAVEIGGISGKVDHVSMVSTKIKTFDNKVVLVPNRKVWGEVITNASASDERRVDMTFGIGYDDDIAEAQKILEKIVSSHDKVLESPEPVIKMNELADSSVNFICRPWSKTADYWDVYWDITRKVKEEFDAAGISIPYPQQDIHLHQTAE
jgi:small conductance mechanosensitive channel